MPHAEGAAGDGMKHVVGLVFVGEGDRSGEDFERISLKVVPDLQLVTKSMYPITTYRRID